MQVLVLLVCLIVLDSALAWKKPSGHVKDTSSTLSIGSLDERSSSSSTDSRGSKLVKALKEARSRDKDKFEALKWKLRRANARIAAANAQNPNLFAREFSADVSTTSYDTSSNTRIAKAVASALEKAEEAVEFLPKNPFQTFRLRLSTTNRANECGFFKCEGANEVVDAEDLTGVRVTVITTNGNFDGEFDGNTARAENNMFDWTLTFTPPSAFAFSTIVGEFGVNVTSIQLQTQDAGSDGPEQNYFITEEGFDEETNLDDDEFSQVSVGGTIGCDPSFSGSEPLQQAGTETVSITTNGVGRLGLNLLVANVTGNNTYNFELGVKNIRLQDSDEAELFKAIGLSNFPCLTRPAIIYDDLTIVTRRDGTTPSTNEALEHPCLYDALQSSTGDFTSFVEELKLAAGRTQIRLRDITFDAGAFSFLSRKSKFTPCFRVFADNDYRIEVYMSMRGGTGQFVRAVAAAGAEGQQFVQFGQVIDSVDNLEVNARPQFKVDEYDLSDLANTGQADRPYTSYRSDVSVTVEDCPEFSYFQ